MKSEQFTPTVPYFQGRGVTLYCAKYEEILPRLGPGTFDALITDPPYASTNLAWDKAVDWPSFWPAVLTLCKPKAPIVMFSSGKFTHELIASNRKHFRYELIWEKNLPVGHLDANRRPLRAHENILVFSQDFRSSTYNPQKTIGKLHTIGKGSPNAHYGKTSGRMVENRTNLWHPRSILRFNNSRTGKSLHPTQKPIDLMKWLVSSYSNRFDTLLEPFAGSGSTLLAAVALGRRAIGIEQSKDYCDIIVKRIKEAE